MRVIIFNGPANSGKDISVDYLQRQFNAYPFSFKSRLKKITLEVYGISEALWAQWYTREGKELPRQDLDGLSAREALIEVSERVIKPYYGQDYFGKVEARRLNSLFHDREDQVVACSDAGFNDEVVPFVEMFGVEDIFVVKIRREGCSFKGDSRNWINTDRVPDSNYLTVSNNGTLQEFWDQLDKIYKHVVAQ